MTYSLRGLALDPRNKPRDALWAAINFSNGRSKFFPLKSPLHLLKLYPLQTLPLGGTEPFCTESLPEAGNKPSPGPTLPGLTPLLLPWIRGVPQGC